MANIYDNYEFRRQMMLVTEDVDEHILNLVTVELEKILLKQTEERSAFRNGSEVKYNVLTANRYMVTKDIFHDFVSYLYLMSTIPGTKLLSFAKINQLVDDKVVSHHMVIPLFMEFEQIGEHEGVPIHEVSIKDPKMFSKFIEKMVVYSLMCDENVLMFAFNRLYTQYLDDNTLGNRFAIRFMQEYLFGPEKEWATQIQTINSIKIITNLILRNGTGTPIMTHGRKDYVLKDLSVEHELVLADYEKGDDAFVVSVHGMSIAFSIANDIIAKTTSSDVRSKRVSEGTLLQGLANRLDPEFVNDALKKFLFEL